MCVGGVWVCVGGGVCVRACVRVEVPGVIGELKAEEETRLGRTITMLEK